MDAVQRAVRRRSYAGGGLNGLPNSREQQTRLDRLNLIPLPKMARAGAGT
jgi:hypothetical protein